MWRNWSGYVESPDARLVTPATASDLRETLRAAARAGQHVRVVGAGHSFSPLVQSNDIILSLDQLQGVVDVNESAMVARVRAGTRLSALGNALAAHGLAMENLGDINVQSVAGATSTGTHGTGVAFGNIATQIAALKFLNGDGEEVRASPTENPSLFVGGRIGLGSLGVLTEISLRLVPSFNLRLDRAKMNLDECLDRGDELVSRNRNFELYWLPHTDKVLTKAWNLTEDAPTNSSTSRYLTEAFLENTVFGTMCATGKAFPSLCPSLSQLCSKFISSSTQVDSSHSMLATVRKVRFNEMEWAVPAARGADAMREIRSFVSKREFPLMFPFEYRWVKGDDIWLSPNFGRDSVHISCHQYQGMPFDHYFDGIQAICLNHGGRPHWGKVHSLRATQLAKLYPHWDDFLALREQMDPHGRFLSPYMRQLFGLEIRRTAKRASSGSLAEAP